MKMPKLKTPIIEIVLENTDGTYTEATVQTDNRDCVRWDLTRPRRQWPATQEAPILWCTFLAWAAMVRGGDTTEEFDAFQGRCLQANARKNEDTPAADPMAALPAI